MRVLAVGMADLGAARDAHLAVAGALESDGAVDGDGADLVEGRAGRRVAVAAAAGGGDGDAGGAQARDRRAVGDLLGGGRAEEGGEGDEGELAVSCFA